MRRLILASCLLMLGGGCRPRTQIMVGVLTDLRAPDVLNGAAIRILRDGVPVVDEVWPIPGGIGQREVLPGSYAIYSPRDTDERIEVELQGIKDGIPVVNRRARVNLVSRQTLFMRMALVAGCMSKMDCGAGLTCIEGTCVSDEVDSRTLPAFSPELVNEVKCNSGTAFVSTETNTPLPVMGSCGATEYCEEGTCYQPVLTDLWQRQMAPVEQTLRGLWGTPDAQHFYAVGDGGTILHLGPSSAGGSDTGTGPEERPDDPGFGDPRPRASTWAVEDSGTSANLRGIFGLDANNVVAVGDNGALVGRLDGSPWQQLMEASGDGGVHFNAVWGTGSLQTGEGVVFAVGRTDTAPPGNGVIFRGDANGWRPEDVAVAADLQAISGTGLNNVWAVGLGRTVMHFDGESWQQVPVPSTMDGAGTEDFFGVFATPDKVYITGAPGLFYVITPRAEGGFQTTSYTVRVDGQPAGLRAVWSSGRSIFLAGDNGVILRSNDGENFDSEASGVLTTLRGIFGAAGQIYAVGESGTILFSNARRPGGGTGPITSVDGGLQPQCTPDQCLNTDLVQPACCNGQCVETSSNPDHCGGCNQKCDGTCEGTTCIPRDGGDGGVSIPCTPSCMNVGSGCGCAMDCNGETYVMDCSSGVFCQCTIVSASEPFHGFDAPPDLCTMPLDYFYSNNSFGCGFAMDGGGGR